MEAAGFMGCLSVSRMLCTAPGPQGAPPFSFPPSSFPHPDLFLLRASHSHSEGTSPILPNGRLAGLSLGPKEPRENSPGGSFLPPPGRAKERPPKVAFQVLPAPKTRSSHCFLLDRYSPMLGLEKSLPFSHMAGDFHGPIGIWQREHSFPWPDVAMEGGVSVWRRWRAFSTLFSFGPC